MKLDKFIYQELLTSDKLNLMVDAINSIPEANKIEVNENKQSEITEDTESDSVKYPTVGAVRKYINARIPEPPSSEGVYALVTSVDSSGNKSYSWIPTEELGIFA